MEKSAPIGLFDSGLGGLTVLKELRELLPNENFIYLGDTARAPYGSKSASTIQRYAAECSQFLVSKGIKLLVVACNTASSLALKNVIDSLKIPVIGTIQPAIESLFSHSSLERVAIIGTRATIASGAYQQEILSKNQKIKIIEQACPLFVPLVEEGLTSGELLDAALDLYLNEIRGSEVNSIVLGCTHYPMLVDSIREYVGPEVNLIECSKVIASKVRAVLTEKKLLNSDGPGSERYFITDEVSKFNSLASLFLDGRAIQAIKIDELHCSSQSG